MKTIHATESSSAILDALQTSGQAMDIDELSQTLAQPVEALRTELAALAETGAVVATKKGRYALPQSLGLVPARTLILRSGAQVARPLRGGPDMLIRERGDLLPMLDDLLLVRPEPHDPYSDRMGHCQLVSITRRGQETFVALLRMVPMETSEASGRKPRKRGRGKPPAEAAYGPRLLPTDPRLNVDIALEGDLLGARDGDMVLLRVVKMPTRRGKLTARIERVLGNAAEVRVQLRAIAARHGLHDRFPDGAAAQAEAVPRQVGGADLAGRKDLRGLTLFTIDGADAQDFDDAVSLERGAEGYTLGVHIADVSHYVKPLTPIDLEALERGTSVYLPGLTLPMLPEALSNDMCSLKPDVDRLALSLLMEIRDGKVVDHLLTPSVIHSRARLTYEQVNRMLEGGASDVPEALHETLKEMAALAHTLRARRFSRGGMDLDMPETAFTLDAHGFPTDVHARSRGESERLIEDFMLLANETVAELARATELPFLYRVHEKPDPDSVRALETFLQSLGMHVRLGTNPSPAQYQQLLTQAQGRSEARLISQVTLRSLQRAVYSEAPKGHFGLAAQDYCHFTSPIRRYPDLTVHRMLKRLLAGETEGFARLEEQMPALARHCSLCEQKATLAERDADDLLKVHYMQGQLGEEFPGTVTGVTAWGVYVTLDNTVEGLVPLGTLPGEWQLDEKRHTLKGPRHQSLRLGDAVEVRVDRVNLALAQIDFSLV